MQNRPLKMVKLSLLTKTAIAITDLKHLGYIVFRNKKITEDQLGCRNIQNHNTCVCVFQCHLKHILIITLIRRGTGPPTKPGFSQGFFSILSPMEFSFLAAVASGLLRWGHFISSTIIDLIAQILFKLN